MIYRSFHSVEHHIGLRQYDEDGELVDIEHLVVTHLGGIDACPACSARAEATFQSGNLQREKDRTDVRLKVVK